MLPPLPASCLQRARSVPPRRLKDKKPTNKKPPKTNQTKPPNRYSPPPPQRGGAGRGAARPPGGSPRSRVCPRWGPQGRRSPKPRGYGRPCKGWAAQRLAKTPPGPAASQGFPASLRRKGFGAGEKDPFRAPKQQLCSAKPVGGKNKVPDRSAVFSFLVLPFA